MSALYPAGFVNPFERNHCAVVSMTLVQEPANRTPEFARGLAVLAKSTCTNGNWPLLTAGGSAAACKRRIHDWARIAGLKIVEVFNPEVTYTNDSPRERWSNRMGDFVTVYPVKRVGQPTVAQFARTKGRKGRWFVLTVGHAQAVINGRIYNTLHRRTRVYFAVRVESTARNRERQQELAAIDKVYEGR